MKKRMYQSPEVDFKFFQASDILLHAKHIEKTRETLNKILLI